ncbi:hypothetical protein HNY73_008593 [Argiope bruennichi]|uniref:Uncharacterized protein n=1 Tax=Argiope bruennichi TaxID=94029 RepID=A0A8T0F725_ARGBR|nr:hypothetical protein HNY73_008593 [Argiope bruennichi]
MYSRSKALVNSSWNYHLPILGTLALAPGGALSFGGARQDQRLCLDLNLATSRLFGSPVGTRSSPSATKCNSSEATAEHLLRCIGFPGEPAS